MSNIAIIGRSGSGKTTVAKFLASRLSFHYISTGSLCREVSVSLFGDDSKRHMNELTEVLRRRWPTVWLDAALRRAADGPVIVDSLRFRDDLVMIRSLGDYTVIAVTAPRPVRHERMSVRGQLFNAMDEEWSSELELVESDADVVIDNSTDDQGHLIQQVEFLLMRYIRQ
jgi:dephospho-CoA kinase